MTASVFPKDVWFFAHFHCLLLNLPKSYFSVENSALGELNKLECANVADYRAKASGQIPPNFSKAKTFIRSKNIQSFIKWKETVSTVFCMHPVQNTNTAFQDTFCFIVRYLFFGFLAKNENKNVLNIRNVFVKLICSDSLLTFPGFN